MYVCVCVCVLYTNIASMECESSIEKSHLHKDSLICRWNPQLVFPLALPWQGQEGPELIHSLL